MLTVLIVFALLMAAVAGIYQLLKSMGKDGVEAAAPGSCKSGRCGVQPARTVETTPGQVIRIDEFKRKDALSDNRLH